jgi:hypothetical protein
MDAIHLEILTDGTITVKTGEISDSVHMSADALMLDLDRMMGGNVHIIPNDDALKQVHAHQHKHGFAHAH